MRASCLWEWSADKPGNTRVRMAAVSPICHLAWCQLLVTGKQALPSTERPRSIFRVFTGAMLIAESARESAAILTVNIAMPALTRLLIIILLDPWAIPFLPDDTPGDGGLHFHDRIRSRACPGLRNSGGGREMPCDCPPFVPANTGDS
jgi:hypothetical protein